MKIAVIRRVYGKIREFIFKVSTLISPELNTRLRYRYVFKKSINLEKPKTLNEKLLWIKLNKYNNDPFVIKCADKLLVRDYVSSCGLGDHLIELLGYWDSAKDISWDSLPQKFVLKWNFGAGMNFVCKDKDSIDKKQVIRQMDRWRKNKYWLSHSEMHYKYIPKKIICEKFLECDEESVIPDYKIYCFHGKPEATLVMHDRGSGKMTTEFFNVLWDANPVGFVEAAQKAR